MCNAWRLYFRRENECSPLQIMHIFFAYQNIFAKHKVLSSGRPMSAPTYAKTVGLNKPTVNILQLLN